MTGERRAAWRESLLSLHRPSINRLISSRRVDFVALASSHRKPTVRDAKLFARTVAAKALERT